MASRLTMIDEELNERFLSGCENADITMVQHAIHDGAPLDAQTTIGEKALHLAVKSGSAEIVEMLLKKYHLNPEVRDNYGRTPLHWAAQLGNMPVAEALLMAKANIGAKDDAGVEPKIYAEMAGHEAMVKMLNIVRRARK